MALVTASGVGRSVRQGSQDITIIRDVSFEIREREFVAIMGPSGSGKSTLMNIVGLLDRPTEGVLTIAGEDAGQLCDNRLARLRGKTIGFVFQSYNLLPRSTALENVEMPLLYAPTGARQRRARAEAVLAMVGLAAKGHRFPSQLSGGEQQRVAIARALVRNPPLLLADEPTGALDTMTGIEILLLFRALNLAGRTIVMVTHDPHLAEQCDRTISMRDGRLASGSEAARS